MSAAPHCGSSPWPTSKQIHWLNLGSLPVGAPYSCSFALLFKACRPTHSTHPSQLLTGHRVLLDRPRLLGVQVVFGASPGTGRGPGGEVEPQ